MATRPPPHAIIDAPYSWYAVLLLTLTYIISFLDRQILTLLIPQIKADLEITDTQVSFLTGLAFAATHVLLLVPMGRLADSLNRRNIVAWGVFSWSAFTAGCGAAQNFIALLLFRMGVGAGEATLVPAAYSLIPDYFSRRKLQKAMAIFVIGAPLGSGLALILGGLIIDMVDNFLRPSFPVLQTFKSWQLVFFIVGALGLPVALLLFNMKEPIRKDIVKKNGRETTVSINSALAFVSSNKTYFIPMIAGVSLINLANYAALTWLPTLFIRHHGMTVPEVGASLGSVALVAGVAGPVASIFIVQRWIRAGRNDACFRGMILGAALTLTFGVATSLADTRELALVLSAPLIFSVFFAAALVPLLIQLVTPNQFRSQVSGFCMMIFNMIGLGLGPTAVAMLTDYVFKDDQALNLSIAAVCFVAGAVSLLTLRVALQPFNNLLEKSQVWVGSTGDSVVLSR